MIALYPPREIALALLALLVLIMVNAALGIIRAIADDVFDVREMARFVRQHVLFDVGALMILASASVVQEAITAIFYAAAAALTVKYLAKIKDKLLPITDAASLSRRE